MRKVKRRKREQNKGRKRAIRIAVLVWFLFLFICVGIYWNIAYTKIDLNELCTISFEGYNTKGTAVARLKKVDGYEKFLNTVAVTFLPEDGQDDNFQNGELQNGNEIIEKITYDKDLAAQLKLHVKIKKEKIVVNGLPERKTVSLEELFQNVSVTYSGTAPELKIKIKNIATEDYLKSIKYAIKNPKPYYKKGDTFDLIAKVDEKSAIKAGYQIEAGKEGYKKTYTIKNVASYLTNSENLQKGELHVLATQGKNLICEANANEYGLRIFSESHLMPIWVNNKTTFRWSAPNLVSAYFNEIKEDSLGKMGTHINDVKLVYETTISQADGVSCQAEVVVRFTNLLEKADGTIELAEGSGEVVSASYRNSHISELVNDSYNSDYESKKIEIAD